MWTFFDLYRFWLSYTCREEEVSKQWSACTRLQKTAQSTACMGSSTPRLRSLFTDMSSPDCWSSSSYFMKRVELVDGDHRDLRPFVPCPHPDLKAILRVADFPCSCAVLYPEHPYLRAHVRLVVAAGLHLRVCQFIGVGEWGGVQPQKILSRRPVGIFIIRRERNSPVSFKGKGRLTPPCSPLTATDL